MVLRIHFTADDLVRTRVATTIGAAAETYYSLEMLNRRSLPAPFHHWRARVAGRLPQAARPLTVLLPDRGPGLDLLALAGDSPDVDQAVDALLRAPRARVRRELEPVAFAPSTPPGRGSSPTGTPKRAANWRRPSRPATA